MVLRQTRHVFKPEPVKQPLLSLRDPDMNVRAIPSLYVVAALLISVFIMATGTPALAGGLPIWWPDFQKQAEAGGFRLLTDEALETLLYSGEDYLLLDVRPKYEFETGCLPGALNLEFHEGHRLHVEPERIEAFRKLAGPDKSRKMVIYCRSFR